MTLKEWAEQEVQLAIQQVSNDRPNDCEYDISCLKSALKAFYSFESIFCGGYIKSGSTISAGKDYGIYAGLYVKLSDMKNQGCIYSKYKPDNIISGHWHRIGG